MVCHYVGGRLELFLSAPSLKCNKGVEYSEVHTYSVAHDKSEVIQADKGLCGTSRHRCVGSGVSL